MRRKKSKVQGPRSKVPEDAPAKTGRITAKQAAAALGIDERTLRRWRSESTFPNCDGGFDLEALCAWRDERQRAGSEARQDAIDLQTALKREKVEQEKLKTQQMRLRLDEQEAELLPRETFERAISTIATRSGDVLDQLPDVIRGICPKKDAERVAKRLKQELDKWRTDLCNALHSLQGSPS